MNKSCLPTLLPSRRKKTAMPSRGNTFNNDLYICAAFNESDGFGEHSRQLTKHIATQRKIRIQTNPRYHESIISMGMKEALTSGNPAVKSSLCIQPICHSMHGPTGNRSAIFTMFETSQIIQSAQKIINKFQLLITPSHANASNFSEQLKLPCEVVHLGYDSSVYGLAPPPKHRPFVFGAAAHIGHGATRKGLYRIIDWFRSAFPNQRDVKLYLKLNEWDGNDIFTDDPRITVLEKNLSHGQCAQWLQSLNCYIDASTFEGWGMWNHNAMGCGRPVIGTNYSARCEYFKFGNHIPIGYRECAADGTYEGMGHWAMPDRNDGIEALRWAYKNPAQCAKIGKRAYDTVSQMTWEACAQRVLNLLKKHNIYE